MNSRDKYVISILGKIRNVLKLNNIKERIIQIKYKIYNLENTPSVDNNMKYKPYEGNKKIVIYTCITGGYDKLLEPYYLDKKCDYIVVTDSNINSKIYKMREIPEKVKNLQNNILINRYIKFHPHELFKEEYDYAIYIDGNIQPLSNLSAFVNEINEDFGISIHKHSIRDCIYDEALMLKVRKKGNYKYIKKQMKRYRKEGFPKKFGMVEAAIIVTDLKSDDSNKILKEWWQEFLESKSMRDQLALPYVLWKNKIEIDKIATLGNNLFKNPKIKRIQHI